MSALDARERPGAAEERADLARQPAFLFFLLLLCVQLTLAAEAQRASLAFGLAFAETFLLAAPVILWCRGANWHLVSFLQLRMPRPGLVALGFAAGAANLLVAGGLQAAARALLPEHLVRWFDPARFFESATSSELRQLMVALVVFAPLCEELVFRGYLQTVFRARYRATLAVAISALLFALLHLNPVALAAELEMGLLFGLLALWTGSLWPAVAAHAANNLIAGALLWSSTSEAPSRQPGVRPFALALGGSVALALIVAAVRRASPGNEKPRPAPRRLDPALNHTFRFPKRAVGLWLALALLVGSIFAVTQWRSIQVNWTDASLSLSELKQRLPDEAARRTLAAWMRTERQRARSGSIDLTTYRALRQRLVALPQGRPRSAPVTLAEVDALLRQADPGAGRSGPQGTS